VEESRREARDAQAAAQKRIDEAQAAQRKAEQDATAAEAARREAEQQAREAQATRSQTEPEPRSTPAPKSAGDASVAGEAQAERETPRRTQRVTGELVRASEDTLTLRVPNNPALQLRVEATTAVVLDGKRAEPASLPEGSEVRASYREEADGPTAVRVNATSKSDARPE
jgi:hypothetical protein